MAAVRLWPPLFHSTTPRRAQSADAGPANEPALEVLEEGVRFAVQPARGQKTGFYAGAGLPKPCPTLSCLLTCLP
jgi:hypothetical protein